ncbi:hypothetical protein [Oceanobacillus caeni]|uniref:hypothetical protein n=1 Tax=Oceanobacillus caeni TaxID=405946 RepID=UPI001959195F
MKVRNNQSKLTLDYFVWNGKKLEIGICKESINSDIIISFLLKNRKTKTSITLDYSFDLVGRTIKYTIPVNQLETLTQGRWDFYSKYKTNNKTVVQRLGFFDSPVASKVIRYQKPIYNKGENAFIPYITEKNGLSINCNNLMNLQSESYNVIRKVLKIKQANIINNKLILHRCSIDLWTQLG